MWKLFLLIYTLLAPKADEELEVETETEELEAETETEESQETETETETEELEAETHTQETRGQRAIRELRERARAAESAAAAAKAELDAARRQPTGQTQPTEEQRLWEQEEAVLRNPEADQWQKYAVQSARDARTARNSSQQAIRHAEELADKANFRLLESTKPKLYTAYKDRVESRLQEIRARGGNAPREGILAVILGEDMLSGKVKSAETKTTPQGGARRSTSAARSDVSTRSTGGMSAVEKAKKRLENVRI